MDQRSDQMILLFETDQGPLDAVEASAEPQTAWSCQGCGHIRGAMGSSRTCSRCGRSPALWDRAVMTSAPVDALERAVGQGVIPASSGRAVSHGMELFQTSPPGMAGCDANPELRVRY